jgi:pimeloyl-ACP methyl ester carboxylesterase
MVLPAMSLTSDRLIRSDGATLAYDRLAARDGRPGVVFLHGLMSERSGTKAEALLSHCRENGYGFVRYDTFGHGGSSGRFEDGTISRWTEDALAVLDNLTQGPQILVGSSMGGWVMVRAALVRPERIAGLIGIAVGPDFTEDLMWTEFSETQRTTLQDEGSIDVQSDYDARPYPISRGLIEDGRKNLVLRGPVAISCPTRLLHGQNDTGVPWETSLRLAEKMTGEDVEILLIKDGDHRLSRPQDLARLCAVLDALVQQVGG